VEKLLEKGAKPNEPLEGTFFKKKGGKVYFGDHPIAFAVCLKSPRKKDIFQLLLKHGAYLSVFDREENSLLHLCVFHDDPDMYDLVCQEETKEKKFKKSNSLEYAPNKDGKTPLTYCISKGKKEMLSFILSRRRLPLWEFG